MRAHHSKMKRRLLRKLQFPTPKQKVFKERGRKEVKNIEKNKKDVDKDSKEFNAVGTKRRN